MSVFCSLVDMFVLLCCGYVCFVFMLFVFFFLISFDFQGFFVFVFFFFLQKNSADRGGSGSGRSFLRVCSDHTKLVYACNVRIFLPALGIFWILGQSHGRGQWENG